MVEQSARIHSGHTHLPMSVLQTMTSTIDKIINNFILSDVARLPTPVSLFPDPPGSVCATGSIFLWDQLAGRISRCLLEFQFWVGWLIMTLQSNGSCDSNTRCKIPSGSTKGTCTVFRGNTFSIIFTLGCFYIFHQKPRLTVWLLE